MRTFLQIDGVRGDVTTPTQYKGWIEVYGFDLKTVTFAAPPGDSNPHPKKRADHTANLTIAEDGSAPALQMAATGGMEFDSALLVIAEDNGAPKVKVKLTKVMVTRFQPSADNGTARPTAALTLDYVDQVTDQGHVPPPGKPQPQPQPRFDPKQVHA